MPPADVSRITATGERADQVLDFGERQRLRQEKARRSADRTGTTPRPVSVTRTRPTSSALNEASTDPRPTGSPPATRSAREERAPAQAPTRASRPVPAGLTQPHQTPGGVPGRRTVTITGRGSERGPVRPRRPPARRHERGGLRPDRMAMWAVLLGVLLVLVAAASSHAAVARFSVVRSANPSIPRGGAALPWVARESYLR